MPGIEGSRTERNLLIAFAGESQARNRYDFYAAKARKEGYVQIADIFEETAEQERSHAKQFFGFLVGGTVEIQAPFPAGVVGKTVQNLRAAIAGEHEEWSMLYPGFAKIAEEEGFDVVAKKFRAIMVAEKQHEKRYLGLLRNLDEGTVFKKPEPTVWRCRKCGYLHEGTEAPEFCPACAHPQAYFEILAENW
ncbi:MAG TPA: rubrerythrin family protein [Candidatus Hydrogenedentes bacterium]|nr:rubrerythrin family protein [Candidatus Hydrogenedentota bacterium]HPG67490.1 rubrerythrin family protein [Candidatus Hydrogenedentota bacterium]